MNNKNIINISHINGNLIDTNIGNITTGTIRINLVEDQPKINFNLHDIYNIKIGNDVTYLNKYLNNGSTINANGDYSSSITDFSYNISSNKTVITRFLVYMDVSRTAIPKFYGGRMPGGVGSELMNGVKLYYKKDGSGKIYINNDFPILRNSHWCTLSYDIKFLNMGNEGSLSVRYSFSKASPIYLNSGDEFGVELNDNMMNSNIINQYFLIQGYIIN